MPPFYSSPAGTLRKRRAHDTTNQVQHLRSVDSTLGTYRRKQFGKFAQCGWAGTGQASCQTFPINSEISKKYTFFAHFQPLLSGAWSTTAATGDGVAVTASTGHILSKNKNIIKCCQPYDADSSSATAERTTTTDFFGTLACAALTRRSRETTSECVSALRSTAILHQLAASPFAFAYGVTVICFLVADAPSIYPYSRHAATASRLSSVACFTEFSAHDLWAEVEGRP